MRRIGWIVMCCLCILTAQAQIQNQAIVDSLMQVIEGLPHNEKRLKVLQELTLAEQHSPTFLKYAKMLLEEAQKQRNDEFICNASYYHSLYYYNYTEEEDSIVKWVRYMSPIAERNALWPVYFNSQKVLINTYIYSEKYEFAINEALQMQEKAKESKSINGLLSAYVCLANAYNETERLAEKEDVMHEAYRLLPQLPEAFAENKMDVYEILIEHNYLQKRYRLQKQFIDEYRESLGGRVRKNPSLRNAYPTHFFYMDVYELYHYVKMGKLEEAEKMIEKVRGQVSDIIYQPYLILMNDAIAEYHLARSEYKEALAYTDTALYVGDLCGIGTKIRVELLKQKGDILFQCRAYKKAAKCYALGVHLRDSLNNAISSKQQEQIMELYHIEQLKQNQYKLDNYMESIALAIISLILLICILFLLLIRKNRKKLLASKRGTELANQDTEKMNDLKSRFLANMSHAIRVPLHSVVGFSQLLVSDEELEEAERKEYGEIVQVETDKLMRLVNSVLDLSRLEANMTKWQLMECDLIQLCNDAVNTARMQENSMRILYECEVKEPCMVQTDGNRLMQLIASTLYSPNCRKDDKRVIYFLIRRKEGCLEFVVANSPLMDKEYKSEESEMRHDINRMTLTYFGGTYQLLPKESAGPTVQFTYPIADK